MTTSIAKSQQQQPNKLKVGTIYGLMTLITAYGALLMLAFVAVGAIAAPVFSLLSRPTKGSLLPRIK